MSCNIDKESQSKTSKRSRTKYSALLSLVWMNLLEFVLLALRIRICPYFEKHTKERVTYPLPKAHHMRHDGYRDHAKGP